MTAEPAPLYLEDIFVDQEFASREHSLSAEQILAFARAFDPQIFHLDAEAAKATFFGGLARERLAHGRDHDEAHHRERPVRARHHRCRRRSRLGRADTT